MSADLRSNLKKWQASSVPKLAGLKPDQLFSADFVERYNLLHQQLWQRLTRVHGTIVTLEELETFPFYYVYGPGRMEFWQLVAENFVDMTIVLLHALVNDTGDDAHTLHSFKNEIINGQWLDMQMCDLFRQTLRERKFDPQVKRLAQRLTDIRHKCVVHSLIDKQSGYPQEHDGIELQELRTLFDAMHALFGALCFGSAFVTLSGDLMPTTVGGKPTQTCLGEILDAVVHHSGIATKPERHQQSWADIRKHIPEDQLQIMNTLRRRIGFPAA